MIWVQLFMASFLSALFQTAHHAQRVGDPMELTAGVDGYLFSKGYETPYSSVLITVVMYDSHQELQAWAKAIDAFPGRDDYSNLAAWTDSIGGVCTIHIVNPRKLYRPEYVGHEMLHCTHGAWHD